MRRFLHIRRRDGTKRAVASDLAQLMTALGHERFRLVGHAAPCAEIPERVITADPDSWCNGDPEMMGMENCAEWRQAIRNPRVVRAMLEDYRAGLTLDRAHEVAASTPDTTRPKTPPKSSQMRSRRSWGDSPRHDR